MSVKSFIVAPGRTVTTRVKNKTVDVPPGDKVKLTEKQAKSLLRRGAILPPHEAGSTIDATQVAPAANNPGDGNQSGDGDKSGDA